MAPPAVALSQSSLAELQRRGVSVPTYPRDATAYGNLVAHVGVGGFHRSHQALYAHELLQRRGADVGGWAIVGVGLMPWDRRMYETLKAQDYLYTLVTKSPSGEEATTVVGSIVDFVFAPDDRAAAVERVADPRVKIVSLTVTEKGYCIGVDGSLDLAHSLIAHDLATPSEPQSVFGIIHAAAKLRLERGVPPFAVLSCDNLPGNGDLARQMLLEFSAALGDGAELRAHVESLRFPNCMVDRITPGTEDRHRAELREASGIEDGWPVVAESFRQWVVEDAFEAGGRPAWEELGVLLVDSVHPYENMKLRLLNGTHSALSYVSYLAGHRYVDEAMRDPSVLGFVRAYLDEVVGTVAAVPGVDLAEYNATLVERFANEAVKDTLLRLCEDGSAKMQTTMREALLDQRRSSVRAAALAVAAWVRFSTGVDEEGARIEGIIDPRAAELEELAKAALADKAAPKLGTFVRTFLGPELAESETFVRACEERLAALCERGAKAVLREYAANEA